MQYLPLTPTELKAVGSYLPNATHGYIACYPMRKHAVITLLNINNGDCVTLVHTMYGVNATNPLTSLVPTDTTEHQQNIGEVNATNWYCDQGLTNLVNGEWVSKVVTPTELHAQMVDFVTYWYNEVTNNFCEFDWA